MNCGATSKHTAGMVNVSYNDWHRRVEPPGIKAKKSPRRLVRKGVAVRPLGRKGNSRL